MKFPIINGTYDQAARESFKVNPASAISWILASSYSYYIKHVSLLDDSTFDKICRWLLDNLDKLEHVNHNLITKDSLRVGSFYHLKEEDYPLRVRISAEGMIRDLLLWQNTNGMNQLK